MRISIEPDLPLMFRSDDKPLQQGDSSSLKFEIIFASVDNILVFFLHRFRILLTAI